MGKLRITQGLKAVTQIFLSNNLFSVRQIMHYKSDDFWFRQIFSFSAKSIQYWWHIFAAFLLCNVNCEFFKWFAFTLENDLELFNVSSKENWRIQGWIRRRHFKLNHGVRINQWPESLGTQFFSSWYNIKKFVDATNSKWRKSNEIRENIFSGKIWGDRIDN